MPQNALALVLVLCALTAPGIAQIKQNPLTGPLAIGTIGVPYSIDVTFTDIAGTINSITFSITSGSLPGLALTTVTGAMGMEAQIAGTPTMAGTFNFTLTFTANTSTGIVSASPTYSITINAPVQIQVSPSSLNLTYVPGGLPAPPQYLYVTSGAASTSFTVTVTADTSGPGQLQNAVSGNAPTTSTGVVLSPTSATTPAGVALTVNVTGSGFPPGFIPPPRVTVQIESPANTVTIPVTITTENEPSNFVVVPPALNLTVPAGATGIQHAQAFVFNGGGGPPIPFDVSILNATPGLSVSPASGVTSPAGVVPVDLAIDTSKLFQESQNDYAFSAIDFLEELRVHRGIPISLLEERSGSALDLSAKGVVVLPGLDGLFTIYNTGTPGSTVQPGITTTGPKFFNIAPATSSTGGGTVTTTNPFEYAINVPQGEQGSVVKSALVTVTDKNSQGSPEQFVVNLLPSLPTSEPEFHFDPQSLIFNVARGGTQARTLRVSTNSPTPLVFVAATNPRGSPFSVAPTTGTLSVTTPAFLTVIANSANQTSGIEYGDLAFAIARAKPHSSFDEIFYFVKLARFFVTPSKNADHGSGDAAAPVCTPTGVSVLPGVVGNFSRSQGFPDTLSANIFDDCGNVLSGSNNTVVATFDNGDPPLVLQNYGAAAGQGTYYGTWTPLTAQPNTNITFMAASGNLTPGTAIVNGTVTANQFKMPVLFDGGTVNNANPLGGPALAPGTVTSIYGMNLATSTASPGKVPLVDSFNGTSVTIGGEPAPFYFLSNGQLNVQVPTDLVPGQRASVAVQVNGVFAVLPNPIALLPATPGVVAFADGHVIAQHANGNLVKSGNPAKPGETIIIYLSGMGVTNPAVPTGQPAPSQPLAKVTVQPVVTVAGQKAKVSFAGLTPGGIGLYQIDFEVPTNASNGDLDLLVTQNGVASNATKLTVQQ